MPSLGDCGRLNRAKTAFMNVPPDTQYNILIHELVHLYLGQQTLKPELYRMNECIALQADGKLINPSNYEYYAQSKSAGISCVAEDPILGDAWGFSKDSELTYLKDVAAECTSFPMGISIAEPDRELLSQASVSSEILNFSIECGNAVGEVYLLTCPPI